MKLLKSLLLLIFLMYPCYQSVSQCNENIVRDCIKILDNYTFLKLYNVKFQITKTFATPPEIKYSYVFSKGNKYKITNCWDKYSQVEMVVSLYDKYGEIIASSYNHKRDKHYPGFIFECNSSGIYSLVFDSQNGENGCGVSLVGMLVK